jgi:hypothetical protein
MGTRHLWELVSSFWPVSLRSEYAHCHALHVHLNRHPWGIELEGEKERTPRRGTSDLKAEARNIGLRGEENTINLLEIKGLSKRSMFFNVSSMFFNNNSGTHDR